MALALVKPAAGEAPMIAAGGMRNCAITARLVALLEATGFHPGRRGRDHLRIPGQSPAGPRPGRRSAGARRTDSRGRSPVGGFSTRWACASGSAWPPRSWRPGRAGCDEPQRARPRRLACSAPAARARGRAGPCSSPAMCQRGWPRTVRPGRDHQAGRLRYAGTLDGLGRLALETAFLDPPRPDREPMRNEILKLRTTRTLAQSLSSPRGVVAWGERAVRQRQCEHLRPGGPRSAHRHAGWSRVFSLVARHLGVAGSTGTRRSRYVPWQTPQGPRRGGQLAVYAVVGAIYGMSSFVVAVGATAISARLQERVARTSVRLLWSTLAGCVRSGTRASQRSVSDRCLVAPKSIAAIAGLGVARRSSGHRRAAVGDLGRGSVPQ
jgi:ABC-2 type transport system ATP-binding protein